MIESIKFKNFKVLRDTMLPLDRFTLLIGPNGSGKSTALEALRVLSHPYNKVIATLPASLAAAFGIGGGRVISQEMSYGDVASKVGPNEPPSMSSEIELKWGEGPHSGVSSKLVFSRDNNPKLEHVRSEHVAIAGKEASALIRRLSRMQIFSLQSELLKLPAPIDDTLALDESGSNLAAVLDALDDADRDRFNRLQKDLIRWMPEFDQIAFDRVQSKKSLALRLRGSKKKVSAADLSDGTLLTLALLTITYYPDPPVLIGLEEPDRGLHPRLLRDVKDALYRLAYPENFGESRPPVQVIVTTHSPYMIDLFKDHPEHVVIANKEGGVATFMRLTDIKNWQDILGDAALGEAWYTGVFGGVPLRT